MVLHVVEVGMTKHVAGDGNANTADATANAAAALIDA